jgi:deoxyribose-phosphate aldolase
MLASRSVKTDAKRQLIDLAISMIDLTTLEGQDTPGKVAALCAKARHPGYGAPPVAAVCVYPDMVEVAAPLLAGTGIKVASVATAFPSGRAALDVKLADVKSAVAAGADEVDMVIDRGAFLSGRYSAIYDEIVAVRAACSGAHLKVILETGELGTSSRPRPARSPPPPRSRSPWSCWRRFATGASPPAALSARALLARALVARALPGARWWASSPPGGSGRRRTPSGLS